MAEELWIDRIFAIDYTQYAVPIAFTLGAIFISRIVWPFFAFSSIRWKLQGHGPRGDGAHEWQETAIYNPTHCNICRDFISGMRHVALVCECCGYYSHEYCIWNAPFNCKLRSIPSLSTLKHQWVEGNIDVETICSICELQCGSVSDLTGARCCWCGLTVHNECVNAASPQCDLGAHAILIVPPNCVSKIENKKIGSPSLTSSSPSITATPMQLDKIIPPLKLSHAATDTTNNSTIKDFISMSNNNNKSNKPQLGSTGSTSPSDDKKVERNRLSFIEESPEKGESKGDGTNKLLNVSPPFDPSPTPRDRMNSFTLTMKKAAKSIGEYSEEGMERMTKTFKTLEKQLSTKIPTDIINWTINSPETHTPLVVFINRKSGGNWGSLLMSQFKQNLNPMQVFDLAEGGPRKGLLQFCNVKGFRVLACGGDGTVGWVLSVLDELKKENKIEYLPPVGVLPLGTGNDLARVLGWGGGYNGAPIKALLRDVMRAHVTLLDRWTVTVSTPSTNNKKSTSTSKNQNDKKKSSETTLTTKTYSMNNYVGIGVDAACTLQFHEWRNAQPGLFTSQLGNQVIYGHVGGMEFLNHSCAGLHEKITVECDGVLLDLPPLEGIAITNINSYAGGATTLWGGNSPACPDDMMLEVVGLSNSIHIARVKVGLSRGITLAQCRNVKVWMTEEFPIQVDGEPWRTPAGTKIEISLLNQAFMLQKSVDIGEDAAAIMTHLLEWGENTHLINSQQKNKLMSELAKRLRVGGITGVKSTGSIGLDLGFSSLKPATKMHSRDNLNGSS